MFKRKDWIIIACAICMAAGLYAMLSFVNRDARTSGAVAIYVDNQLHTKAQIGQVQTITIEQPNGHVNVVRIDGVGVHMESSSCRNQLCVGQSEITPQNFSSRALGRTIVCLPNRVLVELMLDAEAVGAQSDPYAPDV